MSSIFRRSSRGIVQRTTQRNTTALTNMFLQGDAAKETIGQKALRWLDIGGHLSRHSSRTAWLLNLEGAFRNTGGLLTEYERKMHSYHTILWFFVNCAVNVWIYQKLRSPYVSGPMPTRPFDSSQGRYKSEWYMSELILPKYHMCNQCHNNDFECRKECFDVMSEGGYGKKKYNKPYSTSTFGPVPFI